MIYTVTLNPSIDYIVDLEQFRMGFTNRTQAEAILPGGKGINVSAVLKNLGCESTALGFIAGFTGDEIERLVKAQGISTGFIRLKNGFSRINFKLRTMEGTEINGRGPVIEEAELAELMRKLGNLQDGDALILSGSIPSSLPDSIYREIAERLQNRKVWMAVDAEKELLLKVLPYHPALVKPNHYELGAIFGVEVTSGEEAVFYGRKLQEMGARNVLVSMAKEGAVLVAEDGTVYEAAAPSGEVKNAVGAGDSMVAGFLAGWMESMDYRHALRLGISAGSASAFSEEFASGEEIRRLYREVAVEKEVETV